MQNITILGARCGFQKIRRPWRLARNLPKPIFFESLWSKVSRKITKHSPGIASATLERFWIFWDPKWAQFRTTLLWRCDLREPCGPLERDAPRVRTTLRGSRGRSRGTGKRPLRVLEVDPEHFFSCQRWDPRIEISGIWWCLIIFLYRVLPRPVCLATSTYRASSYCCECLYTELILTVYEFQPQAAPRSLGIFEIWDFRFSDFCDFWFLRFSDFRFLRFVRFSIIRFFNFQIFDFWDFWDFRFWVRLG